MDYIEVKFTNPVELNEIILAFLSDSDYEMFEENEQGMNAYIQQEKYSESDLISLLSAIPNHEKINYEIAVIEGKNWNKEWESNFSPVDINDTVFIRAPFHPANDHYKHEIIIEPKMSFGTGHHPTTTLMIQLMLENNFKNRSVLDMGCGSGILAILASQLGANTILAVDFDQWAYENTIENCERNNAKEIEVLKGNVNAIIGKKFDFILANINRNILLSDTFQYASCLNEHGILMQSGFLIEDEKLLIENANNFGLNHITSVHKEKWSAMTFQL